MNMGEKIIIFGAGNFGRDALHYYGSRNIVAFADNDTDKAGQYYCGKPIWTFEELCDVKGCYKTVIALNDYQDVAEQCKKNGFTDYFIFNPQYSRLIEDIMLTFDFEGRRVVIIGVEDYAGVLIDNLLSHYKVKSIMVSDTEGAPAIGSCISGYTVYEYRKVKNDADIVIVASQERAYELQAYLNRVEKNGICILNPFVQKRYYPEDKLVFIPGNSRSETTEEQFAKSIEQNLHKRQIDGYFDELSIEPPLFEHIEIETINRCNGTCDFCPVSAAHDIREKKLMEESVFRSIIEQLSDLDYSGRLAIFSNNEPFLDKRIIDFNKYARQILKKARIHLFTNGSLLTLEKFIEIIPFLDELIIDNYNQELQMNDKPKKIYEYCMSHPELRKKVTIVMRKEREILTTRGGDAPNRKNLKSYGDVKCVLPYLQMVIRPDGKVSLCCNDPYGKETLGDVTKQSLYDIWYGKAFNEIRRKLGNGRAGMEHCKYCDTFNVF